MDSQNDIPSNVCGSVFLNLQNDNLSDKEMSFLKNSKFMKIENFIGISKLGQ